MSLCEIGSFSSSVRMLGISQEIQVKILWTWIKKKKKKVETSGEKSDARLYTWVEVKEKARDSVAKKRAKGVDGPYATMTRQWHWALGKINRSRWKQHILRNDDRSIYLQLGYNPQKWTKEAAERNSSTGRALRKCKLRLDLSNSMLLV